MRAVRFCSSAAREFRSLLDFPTSDISSSTSTASSDLILWASGFFVDDDGAEFDPVERLFKARLARSQHVETDPADGGGQPAPQIGNLSRFHLGKAQPGFLDRVLCIAQRTEYPAGHRTHMGAIDLELLQRKFFRFHPSHLLHPFRHGHDERDLADVTKIDSGGGVVGFKAGASAGVRRN